MTHSSVLVPGEISAVQTMPEMSYPSAAASRWYLQHGRTESSLCFCGQSCAGDGAKGGGGPEKYGERESKRPKKIKQPLSAVMTMSTDYFPAELMTTSDKRCDAAAQTQPACCPPPVPEDDRNRTSVVWRALGWKKRRGASGTRSSAWGDVHHND